MYIEENGGEIESKPSILAIMVCDIGTFVM